MHAYDDAYFAHRRASPLAQLSTGFLLCGITASHDVLEVGAGSGELTKQARALGARCIATDVTRYFDGLNVQVDALQLPFASGVFDFVISMDTIEHLVDPSQHLRSARRVLRPGGTVRFTTPNLAYRDPRVFEDRTHVQVHRAEQWSSWLQEAGFLDVSVRGAVPWLGHPKLLFSAARLSQRVPLDYRSGALLFAAGRKL